MTFFLREIKLADPAIKQHLGAIDHLIIHPLTRLSARGVIWHRGESNSDKPEHAGQLGVF